MIAYHLSKYGIDSKHIFHYEWLQSFENDIDFHRMLKRLIWQSQYNPNEPCNGRTLHPLLLTSIKGITAIPRLFGEKVRGNTKNDEEKRMQYWGFLSLIPMCVSCCMSPWLIETLQKNSISEKPANTFLTWIELRCLICS